MLPTGTTLGPYQILALLGKGGMGEVYRARDTRLGRDVAVKVIGAGQAHGDTRRFEQEARAAGALNHPNVCAVFDIGTHEGSPFVVMELLEGMSLRARLNQGPIPARKAIDWAAQAAHGLAAAHEKGIVHRDLKPENLFLTKDGRVKVLDFGLAKLMRSDTVTPNEGPTVSISMTSPGAVMGTAGYMAPEQVRGEPADPRTDIFALGAILYELLTGKRAFPGETYVEASYRILTDDPPPTGVAGRERAQGLEGIVCRCLAKNPQERFQSARDLAFALSTSAVTETPGLTESSVGRRAMSLPFVRSDKRIGSAAVVVTLLLLAAAISLVTWRLKPMPEASVVRAVIDLPAGTQLARDRNWKSDPGPAHRQLALSPDGKFLALSVIPDASPEKAQLYLRPLDGFEAVAIPGTEGGRTPFFSPDGKWVGFWSQGELKKWPVAGGLPVPICRCPNIPTGVDWDSGGAIAVGTTAEGLQILDVGQSELRRLTTPDRTVEYSHVLPRFLPQTNALLFTVRPLAYMPQCRIEVLDLDTGARKLLIEDGADAHYVATGHLVYLARSNLMAVPFDPRKWELRGHAVPLVQGVAQALNALSSRSSSGAGQFGLSASGTLVYASGGISPDLETPVTWIDHGGALEPIGDLGRKWIGSVRLSPDNRYLAYRTKGMRAEVWVYDLSSGTSRRITRDGQAMHLCWTPDGKRLTFAYSTAGVPRIFWAAADGSGESQPTLLVAGEHLLQPSCWSPDGKMLLFVETNPASGNDIWSYRAEEQMKTAMLNAGYNEDYPDISPDGRWLAFCSDETGRKEVYLMSMADASHRTVMTSDGGVAPMWAPDGKTVYYWNHTREVLMAVPVVAETRLEIGKPRQLFSFPAGAVDWVRPYDVSRDGARFVFPGRDRNSPDGVRRLNLVENWFDEIERRCPPGDGGS